MTNSIYLDNNSTTMLHPEVADVMIACLQAGYANPASQHQPGRDARRVLEHARETIGRLLGASLGAPATDRVIITSGGTESNNLAIRGLVASPGHVLISAIEHPSSLAAADELSKVGCDVELIPVSIGGHVDPQTVDQLVREDTRLVCVMMGNNEVGTLQPIVELAEICASKGIPMHTDAVQVAGKLPIDFGLLGVTSLSISAHKFHGPRGVGALLLRGNAKLHPLLVGGSQQLGSRPGTESIAPVIGMSKGLELFEAEKDVRSLRMRTLRDQLERDLMNHLQPCHVNGREPRLPHTSNISFPGIDRQALVMALDMAGIACSTGSACTSGSSEPSHVLLAMGCEDPLVKSSIRLSLSAMTSDSEVNLAVGRIVKSVNNLRRPK